MDTFIQKIWKQSRKSYKSIVFPEGTEDRVLKATEEILKEKLAKIILIGPTKTIKAKAKKLKLKIDWEKIEIQDPKTSKLTKKYAEKLYELRKEKGITKKDAEKMILDVNYFGTLMVYMNDADGMVTGVVSHTADAIRPALEIIKTKEKFHKVSGVFFMIMGKRLLLFADTAVTINPDAHDLVDITLDTAKTAKKFGIKPKVALLSFSTKGQTKHPEIDKIKQAVSMIKEKDPSLIVDGELQVDSAIVPEVAKIKCPSSPIKGDANVLIFPNLESANIAYKLVERLANAKAIGPILQGLKKPINDISRGCNYKDIVNLTAFTSCECKND